MADVHTAHNLIDRRYLIIKFWKTGGEYLLGDVQEKNLTNMRKREWGETDLNHED